jgi:hypothetical protein
MIAECMDENVLPPVAHDLGLPLLGFDAALCYDFLGGRPKMFSWRAHAPDIHLDGRIKRGPADNAWRAIRDYAVCVCNLKVLAAARRR